MKNRLFVFLLFITFYSCSEDSYEKEIRDYQNEQNLKFHQKESSPLTGKDLDNFSALAFYKIAPTYKVTAILTKEKDPILFEMQTTTDRKPLYIKYGTLRFTIDGEAQTLDLYQNKDYDREPRFKNYLFLPFTDATSGNGSYAGGRYLDLLTTDERTDGTITLDFNKSYNPYCVYNSEFSCPLTPKQNNISVAVKAGVKDYKKQ